MVEKVLSVDQIDQTSYVLITRIGYEYCWEKTIRDHRMGSKLGKSILRYAKMTPS